MRILVCMPHASHVRNFEFVLRDLAERQHDVHLALDKAEKRNLPGHGDLLADLEAQYPNLTSSQTPDWSADEGPTVARTFRYAMDYLRYLEPAFEGATKLRERAERRAPARLLRLAELRAFRAPAPLDRAQTALRLGYGTLPPDPRVLELLEQRAPDVVLVTPLLEIGSKQPEIVRAARHLRIPTCLPVASWDNLTTKGLISDTPDVITVWNERQADELDRLHGIGRERVVVTGAVAYDHWFDWQPSRTREELCQSIGLDPGRPYVLYLGSSGFIAPGEAEFVARLVRDLRRANRGRLADLQVLVRPHPTNAMNGDVPGAAELAALDDVVVYPPAGANPTDAAKRQDYFDSIFHASAALGLNTSGFLETSIIDRPIHVLLAPEYATTQRGTLHFHHLLPSNGGMLHVAGSVRELAASLLHSIEHGGDGRNHAFVSHFIRPFGLGEPASPRLVDIIERLGRGEQLAAPVDAHQSGAIGDLAGRAVAFGVRTYAHRRAVAEKAQKAAVSKAKPKATDGGRLGAKDQTKPGKDRPKPAKEKAPKDKAVAPDTTSASRPRAQRPPEQSSDSELRFLRREIDAAAASEAPVLVGPFHGEVGFELLYWIPLLRWAVDRRPELRSRLHVVSRGGTASWYAGLGVGYVDIFDMYEPEELVLRRETFKQRENSPFDDEIAARAAKVLEIENPTILHPKLVFRTYYRNMRRDNRTYPRNVERKSDGVVRGFAALYETMAAPARGVLDDVLPREPYVTVRFYYRNSFPKTEENQEVTRRVIAALATRWPVVLLNNGLELDDHVDVEIGTDQPVITIAEHMTPADNLEVQSIAVANSIGHYGTYGGLSYLPSFYGRNAVGFVDDVLDPRPWHFELAQAVCAGPGWGSLAVLTPRDLPLIEGLGWTR